MLGPVAGWFVGRWTTDEFVAPDTDNGAGSLFYFPVSEVPTRAGTSAGAAMRRTLLTGDPAGCTEARTIWEQAESRENFGFEYGSLDYLCEYLIAAPVRRAEMVGSDDDGRRLVEFFEREGGWLLLADYIDKRYGLTTPGATRSPMKEDDFGFVQEFLCFGSPDRVGWEQPDEIMRLLRIGPGMAIADLGAGTGYMTYRFSDVVGATGKVYALDVFARMVDAIQQVAESEGRSNIEAVHNSPTSLALATDSVDLVWICNVYHQFYGSTREADRAAAMQSIHDVLRPGGRLVILENTPEGELPPGVLYHSGHAISSSLVIQQLTAYGFQYKARYSLIPQRYILEFEAHQ